MNNPSSLIEASALAALVTPPAEPGTARAAAIPTVLDVRWRLGGSPGVNDYRIGHIPGAVHAPSGGNITDGKFRPSDDLEAGFSKLGADRSGPIGVYCGSGNSAAHAIAAMAAAGLDAALYVGSWSAWSADPARPVATGPEAK